jgi:DNA repair protein RecO (recombination protein O)
MARQPVEPHDAEPAFVLHAYPYRETSLIVEALTAGFGRVPMVARGAKRPRSEMRGLLQAFQPLGIVVGGQRRAQDAHQGGVARRAAAPARFCAALRLLPERAAAEAPRARGAHPALFDDYAAALQALSPESASTAQAAVLRRFEVRLLSELGYALQLTRDVDDAPIDSRACTITHRIAGPG